MGLFHGSFRRLISWPVSPAHFISSVRVFYSCCTGVIKPRSYSAGLISQPRRPPRFGFFPVLLPSFLFHWFHLIEKDPRSWETNLSTFSLFNFSWPFIIIFFFKFVFPLPSRLATVSLDIADPISTRPHAASDVEQCECPWGYTGTSCEVRPGLLFPRL